MKNKKSFGCAFVILLISIVFLTVYIVRSLSELNASRKEGERLAAESDWLSELYPDVGISVADESTKVDVDKLDAFLSARSFVESRLKSPESAKFQPYDDSLVFEFSTPELGTMYSVTLWVDAANSFGAKTKSTFWLSVQKKNGAWNLISITDLDS